MTYSWLNWICDLPPVVVGIIGGILPPVLLAILMAVLPIILRLLARFEGIPKHTDIELNLMTRYFFFQVIHSFLIVSLSSGIIAALPELVKDLSAAPTLLARNLPLASNFFITFVILQGLTATASALLTLVPLVIYYVKLIILGSTPRSIFTIKYTMRDVQWGTLFPTITLLVVICTFPCFLPSPAKLILFSLGIHAHLSHHQWPRMFHVLLILSSVEVSLHLAARPDTGQRDWWFVLPQGPPAYFRGDVCTTNLPDCPILPRSGREQSRKCDPNGRFDDCSHLLHGT